MLPVVCDYWGHTLWLDLDVVRAAPYADSGSTETLSLLGSRRRRAQLTANGVNQSRGWRLA